MGIATDHAPAPSGGMKPYTLWEIRSARSSSRRRIPKLSKVERLRCLIRTPTLGHQLQDDE